ncbi:glycosyltransferase [Echinicola jeungdonensis]|uniref:Glycosyltransferase n=1 Tax=Echinicola jeungdonensis TaxID=709343 RepID=A0ABV5J4A6_9BACT|nr:glycosyltransferase [Echinicola jeungdonensis]MDN3667868.1 glycosyltransferase [Echinicola jeungdonensis]
MKTHATVKELRYIIIECHVRTHATVEIEKLNLNTQNHAHKESRSAPFPSRGRVGDGVNKIRILHCIETISSGGVEQTRLTLAKGLDKDKYALKIICTKAGGPIAEALEKEGVELIPIGSFKNPFEWSKHQKVRQVIRDFKPHIIHGAIFEGMSMAAIGGKLGKVPVVILEETSDPKRRSRKAIWLQRIWVKVADKVIGIAPTVVSFLNDKVKVSHEKLMLINNGVGEIKEVKENELSHLKASLGICGNDIILGSIGRVYDQVKRFSDILEAMKIINNPSLKFLLVGKGPDLENIKLKARELKLEDQLISVGFQEYTAPYYQLMDIFCLASANEGFGLVAAEAMMHHLPVVATRVGGLQNVVVDGETGFLVPPYSPKDLAEKIQILIDQPELRKKLGEAGHQRARQHYSAERYVREVEELYLELLREKGIIRHFEGHK